ncbi:phage integrase [Photorhabdus laumondii]|uniref:phage integrase n=1 Tax=Photorhabdus laumondii TaxID=2218628 RepID=UPI003315A413
MSIKKLEDGRYEVDIRPTGRNGKRIRRKFDKKHEAVAFERYVAANHNTKEWLSKPKDKRPLSELVDLWWKYYGKHNQYGKARLGKLHHMIKIMDDPTAFQIDKTKLAFYRNERLSNNIKASTINRELTVLSGMFSFLINAGFYSCEHPMRGTKKLKEENTEMSYLSTFEIDELLKKLTGDNRLITILCLSTGARWSEAKNLKVEHIVHNRVTFIQTKNSKRRSVPISNEICTQIVEGKSGYLFSKASYMKCRNILKEVKPDLPRGQALHVLRHTFATQFMINGGNIITLQRVLGHSKIEQTMTYAHFSPDFLQDVILFNPLKGKV